MNDQDQTIAVPLFKLATVWAAVGITSWSDAAAALATLYTTLLIAEFLWKKTIRPLLEHRGLMKPASRTYSKDHHEAD